MACGFNKMSVNQLAEAVPDCIAGDFLRAVGFDGRFVAAREKISAEIAWALESAAHLAPPAPPWAPGPHVMESERSANAR